MKLAAICLLVASFVAMAMAQPVTLSGNAGYGADSEYNRLYNTRTVFTFKGKVTGTQIAPPMKGMGNAVTLLVKSTSGRTWPVDVGPEWYVVNQRTLIKNRDVVSVTGSKVTIDGHEVVLAEQIANTKTKSVLALRRPAGRPYWDAIHTDSNSDEPKGNKLLSGQIVAMDTFDDGANGATLRLKLHTDDGEIYVALAPKWFMDRQKMRLSLGQMVNVDAVGPMGAPTQPKSGGLAAPPIVFAGRVGFGNQWLVLRWNNGRPVWFGIND